MTLCLHVNSLESYALAKQLGRMKAEAFNSGGWR